jgi:hypothetical protein
MECTVKIKYGKCGCRADVGIGRRHSIGRDTFGRESWSLINLTAPVEVKIFAETWFCVVCIDVLHPPVEKLMQTMKENANR